MLTIDEVNKITDELQKRANDKANREIAAVNNFRDGYIQGCEDFGRWLRAELYNKKE